MNESDIQPIVVLVAVDDLGFASQIVQILRTSAPFPIKAAITKSLDQVVTFVNMNEVDIVLLDTWLSDHLQELAIEKLRKVSNAPAIVLSRSTKMDVTEPLKQLGAQAVVSRAPLDAQTLIRSIVEVLEASGRIKIPEKELGKRQSPDQQPGRIQNKACLSAASIMADETTRSKPKDAFGKELDDSCSSVEEVPVCSSDISVANLRLSGAMRLKQVLSGSVPEKKQREKLRKRLMKPDDKKRKEDDHKIE